MTARAELLDSVFQWLQESDLLDESSVLAEERRGEVAETLEATLRVERSLRSAALDEVGRRDPELKNAVAHVLQLFDGVDGDTRVSTAGSSGGPTEESAEKWADSDSKGVRVTADRIGPYRLTGVLGQGGMGKVHLAERVDGEIHLQVAIKIIKISLDRPTIQRRFQSERQILASFNHPNIAKLLDAGTTPDGRAFLVMELVEGKPIDVYCEVHRLDLRQRVELIRKVCRAVAYAHQNLVVHRDLKPSNILVTAGGEPKLLDFGIAKLLDPGSFPLAHEPTMSSMRPMTPSYASPEQILGQPITTATDVYALGILLFRLLTGRLPFAGTPSAVTRRLTESPPRPSEAAESESKAVAEDETAEALETVIAPHLLRGDLDSIVLKAIRPEPEKRYADIASFDEDLRAFLASEPVSARRETPFYLVSKFLQRYRVTVGITALGILLLSTAVVLLFFQGQTIREERDRAQGETARAQMTRDFLVDMLKAADATTRNEGKVSLEDLLGGGLEQLESGAVPDELVTADLLEVLGDSFVGLDALRSADRSYYSAFEHLQKIQDRSDLDPRRIRLLLRGAVSAMRRGAAASAFHQVETVLAFDSLSRHPALLTEARLLQSDLFHLAGQNRIFLESQNEILASASMADLAKLPTTVISSLVQRTQLLIVLGEVDLAIRQAQLGRMLARHWGVRDAMESIALDLSLGLAWIVYGDLDAAEAILEASYPRLQVLHHSHHHWTVVYHCWQTKLLLEQGRLDETLEEIDRAEGATLRLADFGPSDPRSAFFLAYSRLFAGLAYRELGDQEEARRLGRLAAEGLGRFPPETFRFSLMRSVPILSLGLAGQVDEAQDLLQDYLQEGLREPDVLLLAQEMGLFDGELTAKPDMPVAMPESFVRATRVMMVEPSRD